MASRIALFLVLAVAAASGFACVTPAPQAAFAVVESSEGSTDSPSSIEGGELIQQLERWPASLVRFEDAAAMPYVGDPGGGFPYLWPVTHVPLLRPASDVNGSAALDDLGLPAEAQHAVGLLSRDRVETLAALPGLLFSVTLPGQNVEQRFRLDVPLPPVSTVTSESGDAMLTLVAIDGALLATVDAPGRTFVTRAVDGNAVVLVEMPSAPLDATVGSATDERWPPDTFPRCGDGLSVLLAVTPDAWRVFRGEIAAAQNTLRHALSKAGVLQPINFSILQLSQREHATVEADYRAALNPSDAQWKELRDRPEDLIAVIVKNPRDPGMARVGAIPDERVAIVPGGRLQSGGLIHEFGHLAGAREQKAVDPLNTPFPFGHGFISVQQRARTIMTYPDGCSDCTRYPQYSDARLGGFGKDGESDVARALRASVPYLASLSCP